MLLAQGTVEGLLLDIVQSASPDPWQTACNWLLANPSLWSDWVPDKTVCSTGKGLVDLEGLFVMERVDAVDCAICPAGRASLESAESRVCAPCMRGSYQDTFGMTECTWACSETSIKKGQR